MTKYFEECGFITEIVKEELEGKFKKIPKVFNVCFVGCGKCECTDKHQGDGNTTPDKPNDNGNSTPDKPNTSSTPEQPKPKNKGRIIFRYVKRDNPDEVLDEIVYVEGNEGDTVDYSESLWNEKVVNKNYNGYKYHMTNEDLIETIPNGDAVITHLFKIKDDVPPADEITPPLPLER